MSTTTTTAKIKLALEGASVVEAGLSAVQNKIAAAKGAMLGMAAGLTVGAFTQWIRGAIDAADEASKLAQKAGLAVKDVAGLTLAFEQSGMTAGDVSGAMSKLSRSMAEGNKAFAAMGLTAQNQDGTLKSTRQMLGEVADKFASYEDSASKTALAMEIFGKSGAEMIPLLNGGAESLAEFDTIAKTLGLTLDEETAKSAEKFNDTLDLIHKGSQGTATQIAAQLLPTLSTLAGEFFNTMGHGDNLAKMAGFLATSLKGLYIVGMTVVRMFSAVGSLIGAVAAATVAALSGDFAQAGAIWKMHLADNAQAGKEYADSVKRIWDGAGNVAVDAAAKMQRGVAPVVDKSAKVARESKSEFDKLRESLERGMTKAYSEAQGAAMGYNKAQMHALEIFASPVWKTFTDSQRADIAVLLEKTIQSEQAEAATKALAETTKSAHEAYNNFIKGYSDSAANAEKRITDMQAEAAALQLSQDWQISLAQAVEHTTIARLKEHQIASMGDPAIIEQLQREIEAREKIIGLLGQKEAKELADAQVKANKLAAGKAEEQWSKTWMSVSESFLSSMMQGGDALKKWLIDTFSKLVLQPILSPQGGEGGSNFGSYISKIGSSIGNYFSSKDSGTTPSQTEVPNKNPNPETETSGATSATNYAGWIGMIYSAFQMASKHYDQGYNQETLKDSKAYKYSYERATYAMLKSVGINEKWASILSGGNHMSFLWGKKLKGWGPVGNFNADGTVGAQNYKYYKGGLLTSSKTEYEDMTGKSGKEWTTKLTNFRDGMAAMVQALGLSGESIKRFAGQLKVDIAGLSDEEAMKKIESDLMDMRESMANTVPALEKFAEAGETAGQAFIRLYSETQAALEQAGISSEAIADVIVQGMTGRLTAAQVGEQLSDIIIGGIYNTIAGGFAKQISDVFMTQIMEPVMMAITAGVPLSQAISDEAINKVVDTAIKAAEAMDVIFNNEAFQGAMEKIRATIGSVSFATANAAPYVNSFATVVDTAGQAAAAMAAQIKAAWRDMGDTLTNEIRRIKGEIVGDNSAGLAYAQAQFAIATAQARAGNLEAAAMLPELSRAVTDLANESAASLSDLRVMQGGTASSLLETRRILSQEYGFDVPAYASGGNHPGGWAIVGEQGPELVNMPASTVYTNSNSRSMLDNTELVNEVRALRVEMATLKVVSVSIANATQSLDRNIDRVTQGGEALLTEAA